MEQLPIEFSFNDGTMIRHSEDFVDNYRLDEKLSLNQKKMFYCLLSVVGDRSDASDWSEVQGTFSELFSYMKIHGMEVDKKSFKEMQRDVFGVLTDDDIKNPTKKFAEKKARHLPLDRRQIVKLLRDDSNRIVGREAYNIFTYSYANYSEDRWVFRFNKDLKSAIANLAGRICEYPPGDVLRLNSVTNIEFLKFCYRWLYAGGVTISIEDFKNIVGVEDKYPQFKIFNNVFLVRALDEINSDRTNLWVERDFYPKKSATTLIFTIRKKSEKQQDSGEVEYCSAALSALEEFGFNSKTAKEIALRDLSTEAVREILIRETIDLGTYVRSNLDYTKKQIAKKSDGNQNPQGYAVKALRQDYGALGRASAQKEKVIAKDRAVVDKKEMYIRAKRDVQAARFRELTDRRQAYFKSLDVKSKEKLLAKYNEVTGETLTTRSVTKVIHWTGFYDYMKGSFEELGYRDLEPNLSDMRGQMALIVEYEAS